MSKVLIIDDNPSIGSALQMLLTLQGIDNDYCVSPTEGLERIDNDASISLVIQDMNFSEGENSGRQGRELFSKIRQRRQDLPIILITAWTQLEMAVELIKEGAADYIAKPWDDAKLIATINNLMALESLQREQMQRANAQQLAQQDLRQQYDLCGLIYQSEQMQSLVELAVKVARSDVPVLITGPNGSGKEKIAEVIQANSQISDGPFVRVNAGALPDELLEAELFGAEPGAYTGLTKTRVGRFESADGGTLFLDEIGNMSASGQAKLLRVLQSGEFERLGSSQPRRCTVRLISATNTDLPDAIRDGAFREDLFYRLNVIELRLPPLAERQDDILPLLHRFLGGQKNLSPSAVDRLLQYPWPGNVRQLENACKRALLVSGADILEADDFGLDLEAGAQSSMQSRMQVEPTRQMIEYVLQINCGVIAQAARQLGMSRQALYRRMDKYGISYQKSSSEQ
ncbi:sigma-54-dependent Fis family transcriptional regulator [Pseudomaricurvus alkylphenolicus]|uniref:sigma-54-dependent transcriptional regulator n=1 Tax=Pseudomaricurvus alkylphenolicus TaxID=1306991 RepID=UPI001421AA60|nr:sigma-54 dependent transcriptional regulator [Pseudomaricurvus alkylphenolicus]NIB44319.1 sigma-54-dependent Fis family transcriptional regulator [Pseudomaricurvus alkylphenolicus]